MTVLSFQPPHTTMTAITAAGHHGAHAGLWIGSWLVLLLAVVAVVIWTTRRRAARRLVDEPGPSIHDGTVSQASVRDDASA